MSLARRLDTTEFKGVSNFQYYGPNMYAVRILSHRLVDFLTSHATFWQKRTLSR